MATIDANEVKATEVKIVPPEGYEIDKENSTLECIKFKSKKLTYEYIANALFLGKSGYYISNKGDARLADWSIRDGACIEANNCVTKKQVEKLLALNKLINVAKYLNGDWVPNFNDCSCRKYYIEYDIRINTLEINDYINTTLGTPCFKSEELAKQAIEILGEETIKLALSQV